MGKELEIKIRLSSKNHELLSSWLNDNAEFINEEDHEEYYFDNSNKSFLFKNDEELTDATDYLRIRKTKNKASTTFKHWHKDPNNPKKHTHCDEFETKIDNANDMKNIYESLGFIVSAEIIKNRKIYEVKDFEIVIDEVKNLGTFAEFELKKEFDIKNTKSAFKEIYDLFREIKFKKVLVQNRGYVSMIWNPDFDFGEEKIV